MNKYVIVYKWWGDEEIHHEIVEAKSEFAALSDSKILNDMLYDWETEEDTVLHTMLEMDDFIFSREMTFKCIKV